MVMVTLLIPISLLTYVPGLYDPLSLPKFIFSFIIAALIISLSKLNWKSIRKDPITQLFTLLTPIFILSGIANHQKWQLVILGHNLRNDGLGTLFVVASSFIVAKYAKPSFPRITRIILITCFLLMTTLGVFQIFGLNPISPNNYYRSIPKLTFGNPNFTSIYFAFSLIILIGLYLGNKFNKLILITLFAINLILMVKTDSYQGLIIFILGAAIFANFNWNLSKNRFIKIFYSLISSFLLVMFFRNFKTLNPILHISERLDYWRTSSRIFHDNPILGIGIDNIAAVSAQFRSLNSINEIGEFSVIDKSHNVFIDYFVTGGIFAGLIYLIIILLISLNVIKSFQSSDLNKQVKSILISIWFMYIAQSTFSPDHLILKIFGFLSAGYLIGSTHKFDLPRIINSKKNKFTSGNLIRILPVLPILIFACITLTNNYRINNINMNLNYEPDTLFSTLNQFPNPYFAETYAVNILQNRLDCKTSVKLSDYILDIYREYPKSYYLKGICAGENGQFAESEYFLKKAISSESYNPAYRSTLVRVYLKFGMKVEAKSELERLKLISPNYSSLAELEYRLGAI